MFNGIIFNNGKIKLIKKNKNSIFVGIETNLKINKKEIGSSFSCNGVCLTLVKIKKNLIFFYVSNETLAKSNLKYLKINHIINLEYSLVFGQKISGHFIQGHVDTTAKIKKIVSIDKTWVIKLQIFDNNFKKFLVEKASVAINGVSLTVSTVNRKTFTVCAIPHTLKHTNLINLKKKDLVNIEIDIISKYIKKFINEKK